jgi:hypothetical protein
VVAVNVNSAGVVSPTWDEKYYVLQREKAGGHFFLFVYKDFWSEDNELTKDVSFRQQSMLTQTIH